MILTAVAALALAFIASPVLAQTAAPVAPTPSTATATPEPDAASVDPWEHTNRQFYRLNKGIDRAVIRPTSVFYHHALAHPVREGVHNVIYNLGEPVTFINDVLQIRPVKAGKTIVRFVTNSTIGILGIFDVAGSAGLPIEPNGFAHTLGRYGVPEGPYIFLPVFGPSSVRDATGRVVDVVSDPLTSIKYGARSGVQAARTAASGLDRRDAADPVLKDVERTATDPYATLRSGFLQHSSSAARRGDVDVNALPDFGPEPTPGKPRKTPTRKP